MKFLRISVLFSLVILLCVGCDATEDIEPQDNIHEIEVNTTNAQSHEAIVDETVEPEVSAEHSQEIIHLVEQKVTTAAIDMTTEIASNEELTTEAAKPVTAQTAIDTEDPIKPIAISVSPTNDKDKHDLMSTIAPQQQATESLDYPNDAPHATDTSLTNEPHKIESNSMETAVETTEVPTKATTVATIAQMPMTAEPAVVHASAMQKCFSCSSAVNASCISKPIGQVDCHSQQAKNGCFSLVQVDTNITTRGCISELNIGGLDYCKHHSKHCKFCYDQPLCNKHILSSGGLGMRHISTFWLNWFGLIFLLNKFYY